MFIDIINYPVKLSFLLTGSAMKQENEKKGKKALKCL